LSNNNHLSSELIIILFDNFSKINTMRIMSKYLTRTMLPFFFGALGIFFVIIFMQQFVRFFNMALIYGINFWWIGKVVLSLVPNILSISMPLAFQIAILLSLTSLNENGEIMALRQSGFSFKEISKPFFKAAVFTTIFLLVLYNFLSPIGYRQIQNAKHEIRSKISKVILEPRSLVNIAGWKFYAEEIDEINEQQNYIKDVFLASQMKNSNVKINAPDGTIDLTENAINILLNDGEVQRVDKDLNKTIIAKFNKYKITIPLFRKVGERTVKIREKTIFQLAAAIKANGLNKEKTNEYKTELSVRQVFALSPIIFFLLSVPIGFLLPKKSKGFGMVLSIGILFSFYMLMALGISIGKNVSFLAYIAPYLPIFVGMGGSVILWKKLKI
jgi:lipopolysaccharide export system permease protein